MRSSRGGRARVRGGCGRREVGRRRWWGCASGGRGGWGGPEALVGLCVRRSIEMVVGIVGILKAGGAYLPLDPQYPAPRLAYMVKDSRVGWVLGDGSEPAELDLGSTLYIDVREQGGV